MANLRAQWLKSMHVPFRVHGKGVFSLVRVSNSSFTFFGSAQMAEARVFDAQVRAWQRTYLSATGINVIILAGLAAVVVHVFVVVANQKSFRFGTLRDIIEGPLLILALAGMAGATTALGGSGEASYVHNSVYIAFAALVTGIAVWAIVSPEDDVDDIDFSSVGSDQAWTLGSIALISVILLSTVVSWMSGSMRLDALTKTSMGTVSLIAICALFAYGLSIAFGLVLETIDLVSPRFGFSSAVERLGVYTAAVGMMMLIVVASTNTLDYLISFFAGYPKPIIGDEVDPTAQLATYETMRAFRLGIYTLVLVSAALMWRRRQGVQVGTSLDDSTLTSQWVHLTGFLLVIPVVALASEFLMSFLGHHKATYDITRAIVLSIALVYVGTSYVPWNFLTLSISGTALVFILFRMVSHGVLDIQPIQLALFCAGLFVAGNYFFRGADAYVVNEVGEGSTLYQMLSWGFYVVLPAVILFVIARSAVETAILDPSDTLGLFDIYLGFVLVYTLFVFFGKSEGLPGPYFDIIPQNEAASMAVDGLLLFAVLFVFLNIWNALTPPDKVSFSSSPAKVFGLFISGAACAYAFIQARRDQVIQTIVREKQTEAENWYLKFIEDANTDSRVGSDTESEASLDDK